MSAYECYCDEGDPLAFSHIETVCARKRHQCTECGSMLRAIVAIADENDVDLTIAGSGHPGISTLIEVRPR